MVEYSINAHDEWVGPCHYGMARLQVANGRTATNIGGGGGFANVLNKKSRTADKGWSSSLGENYPLTKYAYSKPRTWTDKCWAGSLTAAARVLVRCNTFSGCAGV
jgi:hypothetical protein